MPTETGSIRPSVASRCRVSRAPRPTACGRGLLRVGWVGGAAHAGRLCKTALVGLLVAAGACVVGRQPWVAPTVRILYRSEGAGRAGIRLLVAREENEIALTRGAVDESPSYEPRSGWVFFTARDGGGSDLYRVRLSGTERGALVATPGVDERWPVPARDGRALFYTSNAGGLEQIWRRGLDESGGPDGTDPAPVTRGPEAHSRGVPDSAGGRLLALIGSGEAARLVWIDVATGAETPAVTAGAPPPLGAPALRDDGTILYACEAPGGSDICGLGSDGRARRLTEGAAEDREPAWSPDGRLVVFSSNREDANFELYAMRDDGSRVRRLTREPGPDGQPSLVP